MPLKSVDGINNLGAKRFLVDDAGGANIALQGRILINL